MSNYKFEVPENVCTCECHKEGNYIMHAFACCGLCYQTYIKADGTIDEVAYHRLTFNDARGQK